MLKLGLRNLFSRCIGPLYAFLSLGVFASGHCVACTHELLHLRLAQAAQGVARPHNAISPLVRHHALQVAQRCCSPARANLSPLYTVAVTSLC